MTHQHGLPPRARNFIVWMVVALWGVSVAGQMGSSVWHYDWVVPTGLNEVGTAVVMWMLAVNQKSVGRLGASTEEEATRRDNDDSPQGTREGS